MCIINLLPKMSSLGLFVLLVAVSCVAIACIGGDQVAEDGQVVLVHYTGTLDDGTEFDSSSGREPLEFTVGSGQVISGFDQAVRGLKIGESRVVRMEAAEAYGPRNEDLIFSAPASEAPAGLKVGDKLRLGNGAPAEVVSISDETITIDANHPLAGQALTFNVELVEIKE